MGAAVNEANRIVADTLFTPRPHKYTRADAALNDKGELVSWHRAIRAAHEYHAADPHTHGERTTASEALTRAVRALVHDHGDDPSGPHAVNLATHAVETAAGTLGMP